MPHGGSESHLTIRGMDGTAIPLDDVPSFKPRQVRPAAMAPNRAIVAVEAVSEFEQDEEGSPSHGAREGGPSRPGGNGTYAQESPREVSGGPSPGAASSEPEEPTVD
mmetsp:Transcript_15036/g.35820  ORF Transcript_15036/g.35820 Transcript_15036/m.35820 type:complete len:107 (-) Transcript_15036:318-638(-)